MKSAFLLAVLLMIFTGCVSFPKEETQKPEIVLPAVQNSVSAPVKNTTEPLPLAPLPKNASNTAPRPKAVIVNATNTAKPANTSPNQPPATPKFTTDSLSIEEGETKYVYIKQ